MADVNVAILDKPTIVNWALAELGKAPNFSVDSSTSMGAMVDIFWPRALAQCFSLHDWTFCRRTFLLSRQAATPVTGYAYGFDLPGGRFGEPVKYGNDPKCKSPVRDVRIEGNTVFADVDTLYAVCRLALDPSAWDLGFANCFAVALAAYLAVPLLQNADLEARKMEKAFGTPKDGGAGGMFGRLIAQYRAAEPVGAPLLANDPFTASRSAGPWYGRG